MFKGEVLDPAQLEKGEQERQFYHLLNETVQAIQRGKEEKGEMLFTGEAADFAKRAFRFLEPQDLENKMTALMAAFDSGDLHDLLGAEDIEKTPSAFITGFVFEILSKYEPQNPLNNPEKFPDRDLEAGEALLVLMRQSELLPTQLKGETRVLEDEEGERPSGLGVKAARERTIPLTEREYQFLPEKKNISHPDDILVTPEGKVMAFLECKTSPEEAISSEKQLKGFYPNLLRALGGAGRRPGINQRVKELREDFGLGVPEGGYKLLPESKVQKFLMLPREDPARFEEAGEKLPGYEIIESSFSREEINQFALRFLFDEADLEKPAMISKRAPVREISYLDPEQAKDFLPETRNGQIRSIVPAEVDDTFKEWLEKIDSSQAKINRTPYGYYNALIKTEDNPFPADRYQEGAEAFPTSVAFYTSSREEIGFDELRNLILDPAQISKLGGLYVSVFHALTPAKDRPFRQIVIALGERPIAGLAKRLKIAVSRENAEPLRVLDGSFIFGNYQWGHPKADIPEEEVQTKEALEEEGGPDEGMGLGGRMGGEEKKGETSGEK